MTSPTRKPSPVTPPLRRVLWAAAIALSLGLSCIAAGAGLQRLGPAAPARGGRRVRRRGRRDRRRDASGWRSSWPTGTTPSPSRSSSVSSLRSERLARDDLAVEPDESEFLELDPFDDADFEELVRDALDDLPDLLPRTRSSTTSRS